MGLHKAHEANEEPCCALVMVEVRLVPDASGVEVHITKCFGIGYH